MPITLREHITAPRTICETYADKTCVFPVEFTAGLFSMFPDTPWISHCVANNPRGELRSVGIIIIPHEAFCPENRCSLRFSVDVDCTLEIFQLVRDLEPSHYTPTWNSVSPDCKWPTPGGISETDTQLIGTVKIKTGQVGKITGEKLSQALVSLNNGKLNCLPRWGLLIRRGDTGMQTINIAGELKIERDD